MPKAHNEQLHSNRRSQPLDPRNNGEQTPLLLTDNANVILDEELAMDSELSTWEIASMETIKLLTVAFPMMLAVMLETYPDYMQGFMVGHTDVAHSTEILAAYQLSNIVQTLIVGGLIMGLSSAVDTMCSHAFGAKKMVELWRITQGASITYLICFPFITLVLGCGKSMLLLLGQDPATAALAGQLLRVSILMIPFCIMYTVMKSALQAQNIVVPFLMASFVSFIVSTVAAFMLAFYTPLGYIGVVLGSPIAWMLKVVMILPVVLRNRVFVDSWPGWDWKEAWAHVPGIGRLGVSSVFMMTFQMVGILSVSLLAGILPNADIMIAANGIFVSMISLAFLPLLGICIAGAIRMGNALGAGHARRARVISFIVMATSLAVSGVVAVIVANTAPLFARAFTPNAETVRQATNLMRKLLLLLPLLGFAMGMQSVFRACGKQLLCAQLNFVCLFVLGVPLGIIFVILFDSGIVGLWDGNMAGTIVFIMAGIVWMRIMNWEKVADESKHRSHFFKVEGTV